MRRYKPRQPASGQQSLDFARAAKLNTLERVQLAANVKSLLKALDGFLRDNDEYAVTITKLCQSMGYRPTATREAIRTAQRLGLVTVQTSDRSANTYRINWSAVFDLRDQTEPTSRKGRKPGPKQPSDPLRNPKPPLRNPKPPPPESGGALPTDHTDHITTTSSESSKMQPPAAADGGGGDSGIRKAKTGRRGASRQTPKPGSWIGFIERGELQTKQGQLAVYYAALRAGLIVDKLRYQVRVVALCLQAAEQAEKPGGYVTTHLELGDWQWLAVKYVERAAARIGAKLTPEQIASIRTPETPGGMPVAAAGEADQLSEGT